MSTATATANVSNENRRQMPLRPGLLVSVSTRLVGGVQYTRQDLGASQEGEAERSSWQTERLIRDAAEHKEAVRLQGRCRTIIKSVCIQSKFCLICPTDEESDLYLKIAEAEAVRDTFNATAIHSQIHLAVICGRIAENSREAVAAVRTEIRSLIEELNAALSQNSVEAIRSVSSRATQMSRLLEQGTEARSALERAVKESRRVASDIAKQVASGAEEVAVVLSAEQVNVIAAARYAFDDDEMGDIEATDLSLPSVALGTFAGLGEEYVAPSAPAPAIEPVVEISAGEVVGELLAGLHGVLVERHGNRGDRLFDEIAEGLSEEIMEEMDALARADRAQGVLPEESSAPGIVVPIRSMLEVFSQPGLASTAVPLLPTPPPAPAGDDFEEEEI